jgi:hypothetical protein
VRNGFDEKCYELAKEFLSDDPDLNNEVNRDKLAQSIQDTIEDEIADLRAHPARPAQPSQGTSEGK